MTRVSLKWVLVSLILLVWVAGEAAAPNFIKDMFTATANPGPGFISLATSGPPLEVNSTQVVANLNADQIGRASCRERV